MKPQALCMALAITAAITASSVHAATSGTLTFAGQVNSGTCNLAAGDVSRTITLPAVKVADFDSALFAGRTAFELSADCESDIRNVIFLFAGTPDTGDGTLFNNTGTASGIALMLRAGTGDVPVPANGTDVERSRTVATTASRAALNVDAAYHKTPAAISRGTLASVVTVSITYD